MVEEATHVAQFDCILVRVKDGLVEVSFSYQGTIFLQQWVERPIDFAKGDALALNGVQGVIPINLTAAGRA